MCGKTLKFPRRRKFIPPNEKNEESKKEKINEEEHKKRIEKLKEMGLLK